jgi:polysaccharide export outer membrane protein
MRKVPIYNYLISFAWMMLLFSSCGSIKISDMVMMQDVQNELALVDSLAAIEIRPDDILSIKVASRNPENVLAFQEFNGISRNATSGSDALASAEGYRVDEEGKIYLPFLGPIAAAGKTVIDLRQEIKTALEQYVRDVTVQVRFINFKITVLGEVNRPNTYSIPNEKLTILEAIGMAGDFTHYAKRNSILVIRQRSDIREFARIDTQDKSLFTSRYFFLKPNDIIYVEPHKARQYATTGDFFERNNRIIIALTSIATFGLGLLLR